jgi:F0F1-type ATP synthase assembly protein I
MKRAAAHPTTKSTSGKDPYSLGTLASDLMDTTWRIAIPVVIFAGIGIMADRKFETSPWVTLTGMVVGFFVAGALLKRQLLNVEQQEDKK